MLKKKIIIDTDIGDDIDDLLAISLALHSPELEIAGITTVFRNTKARAQMASKLLKLAGRTDIPVFQGMGRPLLNKSAMPYIESICIDDIPCQYTEDMKEEVFCSGDAVDFIIGKVMESDNDITLVPIGPLTNIAAAITRKPEIVNRIKRIVLMGGAYMLHCNEYNILCDPEAAGIVFESGAPITAVGLDVTLKCRLAEKDVDVIANCTTPLGRYLNTSISLWKGDTQNLPYLHDPLAIAAVIDESFVSRKKAKVRVETKGELTRGMTCNVSDNFWWIKDEPDTAVEICTDVDRDRFVWFFMNRVLG